MSKPPSSRRVLAAVSVAFLVVVLPAGQGGPYALDRERDGQDGRPSPGGRDGLGAAELGYRFLATQETLRGQLGTAWETLKRLREDGVALEFSLSYFMRYPDGSERTVRLESFAELERLMTQVRQEHEIYAALVRARTSAPLDSGYTVVVSPACPEEGFSPGPLDVRPDGPAYTLRQAHGTFAAVAVDATVTVMFPGGRLPPLTGAIDGEDVELADAASTCRVRLIHGEPSH